MKCKWEIPVNSYNSLCSRCAFQGNRNGNHQTSFTDCRGPCLCSISYWGFRSEPEVNDEEIERKGRQKDAAAVKPLRTELSLESRIRASIDSPY